MKYHCTPTELRDYLTTRLKRYPKSFAQFSQAEIDYILECLAAYHQQHHWQKIPADAPWQKQLRALTLDQLFSLLVRCEYADCHFQAYLQTRHT